MWVPQLKTSCCGLSLRTGSKIIAWLTLIFGVGGIYVCFVTYARLTAEENDPEVPDKEAIEVSKTLLAPAALLVIMKASFGFFLLLGVYQNRSSLIYYWVVGNTTLLATDMLVATVSFVLTGSSLETALSEIVSEVVGVYYTLVVYSYYRELAGSYGS